MNPAGVGGVETTFAKLAAELLDQGNNVVILCKAYENMQCNYRVNNALKIHDYAAHADFLTYVLDHKPDVLLVHFSGVAGLELLLYSDIAKANIVIIAQECTSPTRSVSRLAKSLKISPYTAEIYRQLSMNVASGCRFVLPEYTKTTGVVTASVSDGFYNPYVPVKGLKKLMRIRAGKKIVMIGTKPAKHPIDALTAFAEAMQDDKVADNWQLHIYGAPPNSKISALIDESPMSKHIYVHGFEKDKNKIFGDADIHLIASHAEGNSNSVCEAMVYGVPSVGYAVDGIKQLVSDGQTGMLSNEKSSVELAQKLSILMADGPLRTRLSNNCLQGVSRFNAKEIYARWNRLIDKALQEDKLHFSMRMNNLRFLEQGVKPQPRPKVSVIVPLYNKENQIEKCLHSILDQSLQDIEIIVVDDCSTDRSAAVVEQMLSTTDKIRLVQHAINSGLLPARRTGYLTARGEYIISCDADDYIAPDFLLSLYQVALNEKADIVQGSSYAINLETNEVSEHPCLDEKLTGPGRKFVHLVLRNQIKPSACHKIVRRRLALQVFSGIESDYRHRFEDLYKSFFIFMVAKKIVYRPDIRGYYYCQSNAVQRSSDKSTKAMLERAHSFYHIFGHFEQYLVEHDIQDEGIHEALNRRKRTLYKKHVLPCLQAGLNVDKNLPVSDIVESDSVEPKTQAHQNRWPAFIRKLIHKSAVT